MLYCCSSNGKYCLIPIGSTKYTCQQGFEEYFFNVTTIFDFKPSDENELILDISDTNRITPVISQQNWENLSVTIFAKEFYNFLQINQSISCHSLNLNNVTIVGDNDILITTDIFIANASSYLMNNFQIQIRKNGYVIINQSLPYLQFLSYYDNDPNNLFDLTLYTKLTHFYFVENGFKFISSASNISCNLKLNRLTLFSSERQLNLYYYGKDDTVLDNYPIINIDCYCEIVFVEDGKNWNHVPLNLEKTQISTYDNRSLVFKPSSFNIPAVIFNNFSITESVKGIYCIYPHTKAENNNIDYSTYCPSFSIKFPFMQENPFMNEFSPSMDNNTITYYIYGSSYEQRPYFHPNSIRGKAQFYGGQSDDGRNQYIGIIKSSSIFSSIELINTTLVPSSSSKIGFLYLLDRSAIYPRGNLSIYNLHSNFSTLKRYNEKQVYPLYSNTLSLSFDELIDKIVLSYNYVTFVSDTFEIVLNATKLNFTLKTNSNILISTPSRQVLSYFYSLTLFKDNTFIIEDSCYQTQWMKIYSFDIISHDNSNLYAVAYSFTTPPFLQDVHSDHLILKLIGRTPFPTISQTPCPTPSNEFIEFISQPAFYLSTILVTLFIIIAVLVTVIIIKSKKNKQIVAPDDSGILVISLLDSDH